MLAQAFQRICKERRISYEATSRLEVDMTKSKEVKNFFSQRSFTHIINCSGYTKVDLAEKEMDQAHLLNVTGIEHLASLAKQHRCRLIHFSTDYVFDGHSKIPYLEEDPCRPLSVYGKTKLLGEERLYALYPQACIIRTSWLFGREGNDFFKKIVQLMQKEETIRVVQDQIGRPTFCDDLVEATLHLLNHEGLFHFANQGRTSWYHIAQMIHSWLKTQEIPIACKTIIPISTKQFNAPAERPLYSVLSTQKYEKAVGHPPLWEERLNRCFPYAI